MKKKKWSSVISIMMLLVNRHSNSVEILVSYAIQRGFNKALKKNLNILRARVNQKMVLLKISFPTLSRWNK